MFSLLLKDLISDFIFYKSKKKFANFQHAFYIQLNIDTYFIVIPNYF